MEAKFKHLDYIQSAIERMSANSFLFKGWSITIAGALFGFAVVNDKQPLVIIALMTTILFWGLDGYYLWIEHGFRALHRKVAGQAEGEITFSMDIDKSDAFTSWLRKCVRPHILLFYGTIAVAELIGIFVVRTNCGS